MSSRKTAVRVPYNRRSRGKITLSGSTKSLGITFALLSMFAFTLNDVGIKYLSGEYALHQIVFIRTLVAMAITLLILIPLEGGPAILKTTRPVMHILRGLSVVGANMVFFMALPVLPLSEVTAIFFIAPLVITVFSIVFLSENVGVHRWSAVIVGLSGALMIMRPGTDAFQWAALLPVSAAVFYATLHMLTRSMAATESASTMTFYTLLTFLIASGLIGLVAGDGRFAGNSHPSIEFLARAWTLPARGDWFIMIGVGLAAGLGAYFITHAYSKCEAAIIAPFEYFALILAIIWGIVIFDEWPDPWTWTGVFLILVAGLNVIWREASLNKQIASERPMPRQR